MLGQDVKLPSHYYGTDSMELSQFELALVMCPIFYFILLCARYTLLFKLFFSLFVYSVPRGLITGTFKKH